MEKTLIFAIKENDLLKKPLILIVDDNEEILDFVSDDLRPKMELKR
jgi:hypothetical protein